MKTLFNCLFALCLSAVSLTAIAQADVPPTSASRSASTTEMVDAWGDVNDTVINPAYDWGGKIAGYLESLLKSKNNQKYVEQLVDGLGKLGLKGGWAKQIGQLKTLGKAFSIAGKLFDFGTAYLKAKDAYLRGDSEAFKTTVTDYIIKTTASVVGGLIGKAVAAGLTAAGCGVSAPVAFVIGEVVGKGAEMLIKKLLDNYAKEYLNQLLQKLWDKKHGGGQDQLTPGDLEDLGNDNNTGGDNKSGYQKPKGIKAHHWGSK